MVYFDINVLIYAFSKDTDNKAQKDLSVELVGNAIKKDILVVSELILCEFAFSEYHQAKLVTFDKGFKKLQNISKTKVIINP